MAGLMDMMQRPELWQWLGGVGGGMSRAARGQGYDISGANQQLFKGMQQRKQGQAFNTMLDNLPEGTLNAAQRSALGQMAPGMGQQVFAKYMFAQGKEPAAWEQKMNQMVKMGTSPEIASGLTTGRLTWKTDPIDGTSTLMDSRTGGSYDYGGKSDAPPPPPPTPVPEDVDYRKALAGRGIVADWANKIWDFFGGKLPAPEADRAATVINNLGVRTQIGLQTAWPGRPSEYRMKLLEGLTPTPFTAGMGAGRAKNTLEQSVNLINNALIDSQEVVSNPSLYKPKEVTQARKNIKQYEGLLRDYKIILSTFDDGGTADPEAGTAPEGVDQGLWQYMTPEERALWQN